MPERQELVSRCERRCAGQQEVLNIIQFQHVELVSQSVSLHLVEHVREGLLQLQCLLDLSGRDVWILPVFQETRALVFADKFDERRSVLGAAKNGAIVGGLGRSQ